ncbi:response regulator transcription factor [Fusibacter tunisiensis]|uniref:Stage 0 sporulation protein A homolog n=1 Tax=Fusibacter tunisiensis TaxID=1008308 RepID=A0ABS2MTT6_9FIRM|nr:response regulator transcription factor [Fusibacter tunisiensis]MBM7562823.1 DNA-binding NarL/FixJ family response regulator [Fusibacter tunisiensis]
MKIRIMIVDDHELIRDSLKRILSTEENFDVVAVHENGKKALDSIKEIPVDLILMDAVMPVMSGIESTKLIKNINSQVKVLILTTFSDEKLIFDAFGARVDGYILKDIRGINLIEDIKKCLSGEIVIPEEIAIKLAKAVGNYSDREFCNTEKEIIKLLKVNYSNKEIASKLNLSYGTVRNYISEIYKKLGESDRRKVIELLNKKKI